jgi:hypothetical protein
MLMFAGDSQTLPGPLEQAEAAYRDAAAQLPVTGAMIARRLRHVAASARLSRDEPQAMGRLHEVTGGLGDVPSLGSLLPRALDGALTLMAADFGTVQLLDPVTGSLRLVTQSGFDPAFCEYFAVMDGEHSACGRAAREGAQTVIADVRTDPGFAPHRHIAAASGFRAVQSTPLTDDPGHLVGMVSTHFARPHRPAALDLRIMALYADVVGEAIAAHLCAPGDDGPAEPVGRMVIPVLPGPEEVQEAGMTGLPGAGSDGPGHERGPAREAAALDDTIARFAKHIVHRLFSIGLSLDSAHSIVGNGPAGDRVTAAAGQVDRLIREVRDQVFAEYTLAGLPRQSRLGGQERPAQAADRAALLHEHMARTARALQAGAANYAALLEQRAGPTRPPERADYPAEIKRWRAFADQAEQMARRWEQSPLPGSLRRPATAGRQCQAQVPAWATTGAYRRASSW